MAVRKTLAFRIIALSGIWVIIALIFTGFMLIKDYRDHTAEHLDAHVQLHLEELVGASQFKDSGQFTLIFQPSDPRYRELYSGWYWEVKQAEKTLKHSPSLGGKSLDLGDWQPTGEVAIKEIPGLNEEILRTHVVQLKVDPNRDSLVFISTAPIASITEDVIDYTNHMISNFTVLGIGLMLAVVVQVRVALKPLKAISTRIGEIRAGKSTKLPVEPLEDVQPLIDELNNLLDHNAVLVNRARNQLGDLAHSVKNPLAVIHNAVHDLDEEQRNLILQQTKDISKSVDHYLSRARTYGTEKVLGSRSSIKTATEDLVYVMQRIYQDRNLVFDISCLMGCWFKGEGQDLEEMLGNLIDNASKWANSRVKIGCSTTDGRLEISVEDDGPGIDSAQFEVVMRRGHKLDESKPGHGQGLGIVKDIAALYGGSLSLAKSELGGLKAQLDLPSA